MSPIRVGLAENLVHKERQVRKGAARVGSSTSPPVLRRRPVVGLSSWVLGSESKWRLSVSWPVESGKYRRVLGWSHQIQASYLVAIERLMFEGHRAGRAGMTGTGLRP